MFIDDLDLLQAEDDTAMNLVVKTAFENRLDLMNQKAQLVDSWRKLAVAANALQGCLQRRIQPECHDAAPRQQPVGLLRRPTRSTS